jgi:DNA (cytosine-5)-methyltransferase 1
MKLEKLILESMKKQNNAICFIDLFAGIGGFHLGIKQAATKMRKTAKCVLAVDIDPKARLTYSLNFKTTNVLSDIKDPLVRNSIPIDTDIICAGFPCQPFSVVGKKNGVDDHRGTLFTYIVQVLHDKKPKAVFLENVRNLLNIKNGNSGKLIDFIKEEMEKVGYPISIQTYKASEFGLPTRRDRVYMVGFRKDIMPSSPKDSWWPNSTHKTPITLSEYFLNLSKKWNARNIHRLGWPKRVGRTIRLGGAGSAYKSNGWLKKHKLSPDLYIRVNNDKVWINDRRTWDSYLFFEDDPKQKRPHNLTPDEAKAMMGFPDDFRFPDKLSSNQRIEQVGNSVAIPVVEAISKKILETLTKI